MLTASIAKCYLNNYGSDGDVKITCEEVEGWIRTY